MKPTDRIQGEPIWTPKDAADALVAAREQPCEIGVPDMAAHVKAVWRRVNEMAVVATQARRDKYAAVFARHAYQGGWSKGAVKCRCGWNADVDTEQDKIAIARQSYELWSQHLAAVVVR